MNLKRFTTLLFVLLFATASVVFAANNTRNVYSVYSDNFNGAHFYGEYDDVPESDIDGIKFDVWADQWTPGGTMLSESVESTSGDPAPEGNKYMRYTWKQYTWAGCGYTRKKGTTTNANIDMSAYNGGTIKFVVRSTSSAVLDNCQMGFSIINNSGAEVQNWEYLKNLSGFDANSRTWQELTYNLPAGVSLSQVRSFFIVRQTAGVVQGDILDIDNIRWVQSGGTAGISFVTKNVSDDQETTGSISFTEDTFGQGWSVASQYIELDIDGEFSNNNWNVRVYSNNISTTTAGLYNETVNDILPMAWKISWTTLPFSYTDADGENANTLEIGENWQKNDQGKDYMAGLYDAGKVAIKGDDAKWWYPWFFVQKNADTTVHSLLINNKGCHTFESTGTSGVTEEYFDTPESAYAGTYDRKPKLFLACNTKEAKAVKYTGSLVVNLSYE